MKNKNQLDRSIADKQLDPRDHKGILDRITELNKMFLKRIKEQEKTNSKK